MKLKRANQILNSTTMTSSDNPRLDVAIFEYRMAVMQKCRAHYAWSRLCSLYAAIARRDKKSPISRLSADILTIIERHMHKLFTVVERGYAWKNHRDTNPHPDFITNAKKFTYVGGDILYKKTMSYFASQRSRPILSSNYGRFIRT